MGDRVTCHVTVSKENLTTAWKIMGPSEVSDAAPEGFITLSADNMNYGGVDELEELVQAGIPFFGFHHAGDGYPAQLYAHFEGGIKRVEMNERGKPTASIMESGEVDPQERKVCLEYYAERKKVLQAAKG